MKHTAKTRARLRTGLLEAENRRLAAEIVKLEDIVLEHGKHDPECLSLRRRPAGKEFWIPKNCTCHLADVWMRAKARERTERLGLRRREIA